MLVLGHDVGDGTSFMAVNKLLDREKAARFVSLMATSPVKDDIHFMENDRFYCMGFKCRPDNFQAITEVVMIAMLAVDGEASTIQLDSFVEYAVLTAGTTDTVDYELSEEAQG